MWTQEEKLQIVLLHVEQNVPTKELSECFGVNRSLLCVWCKQYTEYGVERLRSQNGIPRLHPTTKKKKEQRMEYTYNPKMDTDFINRAIGALIREYREKAGYSQNDMAEKSGLSQQHISQVELGKRNIGSDQLVMLSLLLGFDWAEI
jgi:DNA-binding XRE family transcriptional regulator